MKDLEPRIKIVVETRVFQSMSPYAERNPWQRPDGVIFFSIIYYVAVNFRRVFCELAAAGLRRQNRPLFFSPDRPMCFRPVCLQAGRESTVPAGPWRSFRSGRGLPQKHSRPGPKGKPWPNPANTGQTAAGDGFILAVANSLRQPPYGRAIWVKTGFGGGRLYHRQQHDPQQDTCTGCMTVFST